MAKLSVVGWRQDDIRWSGWSGHARSEFSKRLRSALGLSPHARRSLERQIRDRTLLQLSSVPLEHVEKLRHIMEALGAEVVVDMETDSP